MSQSREIEITGVRQTDDIPQGSAHSSRKYPIGARGNAADEYWGRYQAGALQSEIISPCGLVLREIFKRKRMHLRSKRREAQSNTLPDRELAIGDTLHVAFYPQHSQDILVQSGGRGCLSLHLLRMVNEPNLRPLPTPLCVEKNPIESSGSCENSPKSSACVTLNFRHRQSPTAPQYSAPSLPRSLRVPIR